MAQPTWVEMQKVCAGVSGMKTDSICVPSPSRRTNFCVPSSEMSCRDDGWGADDRGLLERRPATRG